MFCAGTALCGLTARLLGFPFWECASRVRLLCASRGTCPTSEKKEIENRGQHVWDYIPPFWGRIAVVIGFPSRWFVTQASEIETRPPGRAGSQNRIQGSRSFHRPPPGRRNDLRLRLRPTGSQCEPVGPLLGHPAFAGVKNRVPGLEIALRSLPLSYIIFSNVRSLFTVYPKYI